MVFVVRCIKNNRIKFMKSWKSIFSGFLFDLGYYLVIESLN
ncbi:hypothetical protein HMPREF0557_00939 [Listeria innocua ATCC 33091]|uniref:Uncharacterized protein n=1 Tax=Listeria innocua ATCC 33091 TaxID=1002366 RepID=A0AB72ZA94_LISIO|nr:hypothetical protein HMPREF0557_00939 [Listeria innocua ATCC 33091]